MLVIVVLTLDFPDDEPDKIVEVIKHLDPPKIPYFNKDLRVAVGMDAKRTINWLDGRKETVVGMEWKHG